MQTPYLDRLSDFLGGFLLVRVPDHSDGATFWFRAGTSFFYFAGGFQLRRTWIGSAGALSSSVTIRKRPSRETSY